MTTKLAQHEQFQTQQLFDDLEILLETTRTTALHGVPQSAPRLNTDAAQRMMRSLIDAIRIGNRVGDAHINKACAVSEDPLLPEVWHAALSRLIDFASPTIDLGSLRQSIANIFEDWLDTQSKSKPLSAEPIPGNQPVLVPERSQAILDTPLAKL